MCLSGATCLSGSQCEWSGYVVRSHISYVVRSHNSVPEWSDMSICGPFRFTIVCLSGATCLYVVRSQVHNSVS